LLSRPITLPFRTYRSALDEDLKPGEYGFFMGTGQQTMMSSNRGGTSGGAATERIVRFHEWSAGARREMVGYPTTPKRLPTP
jgi:hypothetical protein